MSPNAQRVTQFMVLVVAHNGISTKQAAEIMGLSRDTVRTGAANAACKAGIAVAVICRDKSSIWCTPERAAALRAENEAASKQARRLRANEKGRRQRMAAAAKRAADRAALGEPPEHPAVAAFARPSIQIVVSAADAPPIKRTAPMSIFTEALCAQ